MNNWIFDEKKHCGVDYSQADIFENYDKEHSSFRDFKAEAKRIVNILKITKRHRILDIGCGTGAFAINAAQYCKEIKAVDVSSGMLGVLNKKIKKQKIKNIKTECKGFLTYEHKGEPFDAAVCSVCLHHLPDFWKVIALKNIAKALTPKGKLYFFDVVFSSDPADYKKSIDGWLKQMKKTSSPKVANEALIHVRDEYSTWDWIMDSIIRKSGFKITKKNKINPYTIEYLCGKAQ